MVRFTAEETKSDIHELYQWSFEFINYVNLKMSIFINAYLLIAGKALNVNMEINVGPERFFILPLVYSTPVAKSA